MSAKLENGCSLKLNTKKIKAQLRHYVFCFFLCKKQRDVLYDGLLRIKLLLLLLCYDYIVISKGVDAKS